jgi:hypothetical protein
MDTTPEPSKAVEEFVKHAERLASDTERHIPSWLRPGDPESRLPVLAALIVAITLQLLISKSYTLVPRWPLVAAEVLLLAVLVVLNPMRLTRSTLLGKYATWVLLGAITVDNTLSAIVLNARIISGEVSNNAPLLLGSGAAIFVTNIIVFGIWYWELDRGGPFARRAGTGPIPISFSHKWIRTPRNWLGPAGGRRSSTTSTSASLTWWRSHRPTPCRCRAGRR